MIANRTLNFKSVAKQPNINTMLINPTLAMVRCAIGILQLTSPRGVFYCSNGCQMKTCVKCHKTKDESEFHTDRLRPDGHFPYCKECRKIGQPKPIARDGYKICTRCEKEKPLFEFGIHVWRKDGLNSWCKECNLIASRNRRTKIPDQVRESSRLTMQKLRANGYDWAKRNLDKARLYAHQRRTKKAQNGGEYTIEGWEALCVHYGNKCLACDRTDVKLTFDHIIPLDRGGSNSLDNAQPLCKSCNCSKGTKIIDYRPETDQAEFAKIIALLPPKYRRDRKLPPSEILVSLRQTMTLQEIADKYSVRAAAVRKQLKKAGKTKPY